MAQPSLNRPIPIEVAGEPVGIVVPSASGYKFLAVKFPVFAIDGVTFDTLDAARDAARDIVGPSGDGRGASAAA